MELSYLVSFRGKACTVETCTGVAFQGLLKGINLGKNQVCFSNVKHVKGYPEVKAGWFDVSALTTLEAV